IPMSQYKAVLRFTNKFPSDLLDAILRSSVKSINYVLLFFGCVVFHVLGTWSLPLIDRDEPRFAEASREMIGRGNYIVPYFNNQRFLWWWIFYLSLGLGFLAKGPIAWTPLLTVAVVIIYTRDWQLLRRFKFVGGILLTLLAVALWGIPALIQTHGEFFSIGIGRHVIGRSLT